jgi:Uma2 family endonuclease
MHVEDKVDAKALLERWREVGSDEFGLNLDRYELTERGEVVVTPRPTAAHQAVGGDLVFQITSQLGKRAAQEVSILTPDLGIRIPDVIWMPIDRWEGLGLEDPLLFVPDLCIEVVSKGNSRTHIEDKRKSYLVGGAREVIIVTKTGGLEFWGAEGARTASALGLTLELDKSLFRQD